ncbi:S49 family peptidase [Halobacteriales archaeon QS_9_67_17]|nr:MAG: S49 family peptidase [Halobacteriales archaeon QS_9_67_17]
MASTDQSPLVVAVIAGVLVGAAVAPVAYGYTADASDDTGTVAVVELTNPIAGTTAQPVVRELRAVRNNESIDAVVLRIDSPGGGAGASEALYLAVKRTAAAKPTVVSVGGVAASGGYYAAAPADSIFVTPASIVGSVGVRASLPDGSTLPRGVTTGPDKASGGTAEETLARVETLRQAFLGSVMSERGDELSLSREEVGQAKVYSGKRAVNNGLADEIGGIDAAIARAASEAGVDSYDVVYRGPDVSRGFFLFGSEEGSVDRVRYLMLYGEVDAAEATNETETARAVAPAQEVHP